MNSILLETEKGIRRTVFSARPPIHRKSPRFSTGSFRVVPTIPQRLPFLSRTDGSTISTLSKVATTRRRPRRTARTAIPYEKAMSSGSIRPTKTRASVHPFGWPTARKNFLIRSAFHGRTRTSSFASFAKRLGFSRSRGALFFRRISVKVLAGVFTFFRLCAFEDFIHVFAEFIKIRTILVDPGPIN